MLGNDGNIDRRSAWYRNCKQQRKREAKICQDCPFRKDIEEAEKEEISKPWMVKG